MGAPRLASCDRRRRKSSSAQLEAAARYGFPTEIIAEDEIVDAEEFLLQQTNLDPEITYLVLTRTDAQIVWGRALRDEPPIPEEAILGPWVAPYLKFGDRDTALKAFVFSYLRALHSAGPASTGTRQSCRFFRRKNVAQRSRTRTAGACSSRF